ncbi:MAG: hypothetical protein GC150_12285 [Rhizobiales bacterium]|nr:hypothetical protein [Hyphomicrobiales bacterium]
MIGSWATDRASGFTDGEVEALLRIQDRLALACKVAIKSQLMRNIAETYLGIEAGRHVLDGQIKRGDGQSIEAAIWYCDLRASTRMADTLAPEHYIANLNSYYDATGGAVQAAGGEILSFIGDGVLAIFTKGPNEQGLDKACARAAEAARMACANLSEVNDERTRTNLEPLAHGLALHVGTVMYGNVGVPERLTFSAFGAAVNEVVRLEALTKKLGEPVLTSAAFIECLGSSGRFLGEHVLRGVGAPLAVHALDMVASA